MGVEDPGLAGTAAEVALTRTNGDAVRSLGSIVGCGLRHGLRGCRLQRLPAHLWRRCIDMAGCESQEQGEQCEIVPHRGLLDVGYRLSRLHRVIPYSFIWINSYELRVDANNRRAGFLDFLERRQLRKYSQHPREERVILVE